MSSQLLSPHELAERGPAEAVRLPLELIDPSPRNPRAKLNEIDLLADSIRTFGLLQPITVRRADGERYEVIGGHRRLAAFGLLREREPHEVQWRTIPSVVRTADDDQAELMLIASQVQIAAWKPREEAAALERLVQAGMTLKQVGTAVHRTESWASKRLRVYADPVLSGYVQTGKLPTGVADVLVAVKDVDERRDLAERAAAEGWSQVQAQSELRKRTLGVQLRDIARRAAELADILSSVDPQNLPSGATKDLWLLHGRIEVLARAGQPVIPSIEAAQRAAGVARQERPLKPGQRRRPGLKPRG